MLLSDQSRLLALILGCAVLWTVETWLPLYRYEPRRWRRALPNIVLTSLLVLTNLALSFVTAGVSQLTTNNKFGLFYLFNMPLWLTGILGVMALDLFTYIGHVLLHKSWLGWQFHRVHHSDNEVNVTTAFRQHPGETVWRILWYVLAIAVFGLPMWVVLVYLVGSTVNAQLEHANTRYPASLERALRLIVVTPDMHKVHHSRAQIQTDTNYSNIFSFWDRIFRTYEASVDFNELRYGLDGFDVRSKQSLVGLLSLPFQTDGPSSTS